MVGAQASGTQIVVVGPADGGAVRIDGAEAGTTPATAAVQPGSHLVDVTAPDGSHLRRVVSVAAGTSVVVELGAASPSSPRTDRADATGRSEPQSVASAGAGDGSPRRERVPIGGGDVPLSVTSGRADLVLQRETGIAVIPGVMVTSSGAAIATAARRRIYERICLAPCDALVPAGEHRFGISLGDSERVVPIPGVHRLTSATRLDLSFTSHDGERVAGWVVLGLGVAGGLALALGNLLAQAFQIRGGWSATPENVAQVVAGGVVVTASVIVGLIFGLRGDDARMDVIAM